MTHLQQTCFKQFFTEPSFVFVSWPLTFFSIVKFIYDTYLDDNNLDEKKTNSENQRCFFEKSLLSTVSVWFFLKHKVQAVCTSLADMFMRKLLKTETSSRLKILKLKTLQQVFYYKDRFQTPEAMIIRVSIPYVPNRKKNKNFANVLDIKIRSRHKEETRKLREVIWTINAIKSILE